MYESVNEAFRKRTRNGHPSDFRVSKQGEKKNNEESLKR